MNYRKDLGTCGYSSFLFSLIHQFFCDVDFKMYGISKFLERVLKSQRVRKELVIPLEVDSIPPILPPQYSSLLECPISIKYGVCDKTFGTLNALQSTWIKAILNQFKQDDQKDIPLWTYPSTPKWSMRLALHDYLLKPLSIWHLERQLGIFVCSQQCPTCHKQGYLRFKEFSSLRHVHDLQYDCYFTSTVYICATQNGCGATFSIMDEDVFKNNIIPYEAFLQCPVQIFHTTAWTTSLVQSMFDLTTSRAGINDSMAMVKKA